MNILDLLLLLAVAVAAVTGYRLGLIARAASWGGLVAGLALSTFTVPLVLGAFDGGSALARLLAGMLALTVTVGVLSAVGQAVGLRLRGAVHATPLRGPDHALGALAGVAGLLVLVWFLVPAASQVAGGVARQVRTSAIVDLIRDVTPEPPDPLQALRTLVDTSRFPEVFQDLRPAPDTGPPPSEIPVSQEVVATVTASTVNVESLGCGRGYEGSGFAVEDELVVTNAHVVAGADDVQVRRPDGEVLDAQVVVFDDDRDLALLRVPGLDQRPLAIAAATPGENGVEIGYPGGQNQPRPQPVHVNDSRTAIGRDIYGRDRTEREVLFLSARLAKGDSGAPVADADGAVIGVVFAISPDRDTTAYALAHSEVVALLDEPREPTTSRCQ